MRYALKLESIGDHAGTSAARRWIRGRDINKRDLFLLQHGKRLKPWVAKITGLDGKFGLARDFIDGQKDYSEASGVGNRGVYFYYWLESGLYEVNERVSVKCARRYFLHVGDDATATELTKEQVFECLQLQKTKECLA